MIVTDNEFQNDGLTYYWRKYEDPSLYNLTKKPEDVGKFKTAGLGNVMKTAPWFHTGLFPKIDGVMNRYNIGMPVQWVKPRNYLSSRFSVVSSQLAVSDFQLTK